MCTAIFGRRTIFFLLLILTCQFPLLAQQLVVPLWPGVAPGSERKTAAESVRVTEQGDHVISGVHHPSITVYLPVPGTDTGVSVLVIPGGGHREIWIDHEGYNVAAWLSQHGIAAFVLKYRLAREPGSTYTVEGTELQDTQRAIRLIRSRAAEWKVDPDRIGVMGFSAGGELAALAGTRFDAGNANSADAIDRMSSKPAFQALIYPAIPHEIKLSKETPPAFLACGALDRPDMSEGLPQLYLEMKHAGATAELHIFAGTGHGFGIRSNNASNVKDWPELFDRWLDSSGFFKK
jgi:endo-1,4-beta-xylanase